MCLHRVYKTNNNKISNVTIDVINNKMRSFQENIIEEHDKTHSVPIKELEYYNKMLVKKVMSLEAINNKCM